ncbi:hypothetical protein MIND_00343700 [Mycena indigotica]|uniref:Uncharacterized protein n=1 Tax=Mycena indigotica TaxID=2126181 RepID=A0A8H6W8J5_9AGAR|nr:uncharacterized protein MIND_00343700 [Mycena indigotica]KAF7309719.1 hypothetical protein MIND_00343700 [Mycena indigotica]
MLDLPPTLLQYIFSLPLDHIVAGIPDREAKNLPPPSKSIQLEIATAFPPLLALLGLGSVSVLLAALLLPGNGKPTLNGTLSEATVLRIHALAAHQPHRLPDSDGDPDDTIPALPFSKSPRKQSLLIFWLLALFLVGMLAYIFRVTWAATLSSFIAEKRHSLSWTLTITISILLAKIAGPLTRFVLVFVPIANAIAQWGKYAFVLLSVRPVALLQPLYMASTRVVHHNFPNLTVDHPIQTQIDKLFALASSVLSVLGGYRLAAARVARNHTTAIKWTTHSFDSFFQLKTWPYLPLEQMRSLTATIIRHVLAFSLGGTTWASSSRHKLYAMLGPALLVTLNEVYYYCTYTPPRTEFEIALDPVRMALQSQKSTLDRQQILFQRLAVEQADFKQSLMQSLDRHFANLREAE